MNVDLVSIWKFILTLVNFHRSVLVASNTKSYSFITREVIHA